MCVQVRYVLWSLIAKRERERDRDRETERQRETETDRQTDRQIKDVGGQQERIYLPLCPLAPSPDNWGQPVTQVD